MCIAAAVESGVTKLRIQYVSRLHCILQALVVRIGIVIFSNGVAFATFMRTCIWKQKQRLIRHQEVSK